MITTKWKVKMNVNRPADKIKSTLLYSFIVVLTVSFLSPGCCRYSPSKPSEKYHNPVEHPPGFPQDRSDLTPDPAAVFGILDNGVRYILYPNKTPKERVSVHMCIDAGSFHETDTQQGIAHFLEHMVFNGSKHFPPGELVKYFQRIGMDFGPDANASTGFLHTVYDLDLPSGNPDTIDEGLLVLRDYADGALLLESEVNKERNVILAEKRTRDSADYRTWKSELSFELPETRFAKRLPIGKESVIKNADSSLLKSFYKKWYRPDRIWIIMAGDFDEDIAKNLVAKHFSQMSPAKTPLNVPDPGPVRHKGISAFYHFEPETGATDISIEVVKRDPPPSDGSTFRIQRLYSKMANRIINYRIEKMINKGNAPFLFGGIYSGYSFKTIRSAEITASCQPEKWDETLKALEHILRQAMYYGFSPMEIERVKKEFSAEIKKAVMQASTRKSSRIAREILASHYTDQVYCSPSQKADLLLPAISSVTPADLSRALKEDWDADHRLILVTGNVDLRSTGTSPEKIIVEKFKQSKSEPVNPPEKTKVVQFPYLEEAETPGAITEIKKFEDIGVTRVTFANGCILLIKPTDYEKNKVKAALSFGNGESGEPATEPGLTELTEIVINQSGLGHMDKDSLEAALAGKNTSVTFGINEDSCVFYGSTIPDELSLLFSLFYAHITDPGFDENAYTYARNSIKQRYAALTRMIEGGIPLYAEPFFAGGDPRFGLPPIEVYKKTDLAEIRKWFSNELKVRPIEIAVVGDISTDKVIRIAAKTLGTIIIDRPEKKNTTAAPHFREGRKLVKKIPTSIIKGWIGIGFPTTDIWDIEKTRRLSLLASIFSDRMRLVVREKLGDAYSAGARHYPSKAYKGFGKLLAQAVVDPERMGAVSEIIRQIAEEIRTHGISDDELERAKAPILASIKKMQQSNGYWLNTVLLGAGKHPVQLDWSRTIYKSYEAITKADIEKIARKYLDVSKAAEVRLLPEKNQ